MPTLQSATGPPPPDPLVDALVQVSFVITASLSRIAAEANLSLTQLRVLAILRDRQLAMSTLAAHLGLDRSTLSGLIDRAEKRGLVLRTPSPSDGRGVQVSLTNEGLDFAQRAAADVAKSLSALTSPLTPGEAQRLTGLLERMLGPSQRRLTKG